MAKTSLVIILSLLCLTFQTTAGDLIDDVCGNPNVTYKDLCESTLRSDPRSKTPLAVQVLVKISLKSTTDKLEATQGQIHNLIANSTDQDILKPLRDCDALYSISSDKFHQAMFNVDHREFGQLYANMDVASSNTVACESTFKAPTSPLSSENRDLTQLCSNVVGIAKQVPL